MAIFDLIIGSFATYPLFYIGVLLSFMATIGFLVYLRGFIAGIGNVFTRSGHVEHVEHAQVRAVWGVLILTSAFVYWTILRWIASLFS